MQPKIFLIDDDEVFRDRLKEYLESEYFSVSVAVDGEDALSNLDIVNPDIIILDIRMPVKDGLDVCREIRQKGKSIAIRIGIIMISGERKEMVDKVLGLELGADRYLIKPFEPRELLAEINALWRLIRPIEKPRIGWFIVDEKLRIHHQKRIVEKDGKPLSLTKLEFDVLAYLAQHANVPRSRSALGEDVWMWKHENYVDRGDNPINKCIAGLRGKIETDPQTPKYIIAIRGVGYKLVTKT